MIKSLSISLLAGLLFTSCSSVAHIRSSESPDSFPKTDATTINVYSTSRIDSDYIILGQVIASADAGSDANVPVTLLKKEASKLGADAILDLRLEIDYGYWSNAIKATGTAVKLK